MRLSVVATLYESAPYIHEFHRRVTAAAQAVAGDDYEIILVNDGSPDSSLAQAIEISRSDERVVVVDLSRNFGHHKAMMTGLAYVHGDLVYLLDSDLEEQPEWLQTMLAQLEEEQCDVVYGVQRTRKGGAFERWSGALFYKIMLAMSGVEMPTDMVTARVMTRRYVEALVRHEEREIDIGGLWVITGFEQRPQLVTKLSQTPTTYTFAKKISLLVNSITSFSSFPLTLIFYVGVIISFLSAVSILFLLAIWMVTGGRVSGWASLMASVWLLGGMLIASVGVIGLYLSKMLSEVKRRPYTIVRKVYGRDRSR